MIARALTALARRRAVRGHHRGDMRCRFWRYDPTAIAPECWVCVGEETS